MSRLSILTLYGHIKTTEKRTIVYSNMVIGTLMGGALEARLQELLQLLCWRDRQEVRSEDQGIQERSGLFHSWYTDPSLQGKVEQCNSQVSHHRPCRKREPCHRLGQGKSGRQRVTAIDQMNKRGTLDQEDTDVHESGCRILPTQPHMGPDDIQVTCSIQL